MARVSKQPSLEELIADAVQKELRARITASWDAANPRRRQDEGSRPALPDAAPATSAHGSAETTAAPSSAGASSSSAGAGAGAGSAASGAALVDLVRADLAAAYDGRPVSADRIAFRLKVERDLVDSVLTYLVRQKEARALGARGKIGYLPRVRPR